MEKEGQHDDEVNERGCLSLVLFLFHCASCVICALLLLFSVAEFGVSRKKEELKWGSWEVGEQGDQSPFSQCPTMMEIDAMDHIPGIH